VKKIMDLTENKVEKIEDIIFDEIINILP